ncbi:MAG: flagellin FliC [Candidatus Pristimantibacillus lignocellulolyticus]|uniref:Flagellin n=1 Tax=Candidatus Pristimantibacillus lignocellulolyticus TaxID=2994561 RepID=A0A9J6ZIQ5_9BACL|nr:MAG: flagellin FliC [Candidatus Pristimantibacillus lignocellulolyticus]
MFINTNVGAMNAHRNLTSNNGAMNKTMEKLSSGYRINRAADDAAGLAISEKMRYQINGMNQAQRNAQDGISLIQTAEGALTETHAMLQRINTLANQSKNGTYSSSDRTKLNLEVTQLVSEINNIATGTKFNGISLLASAGSITFQTGVNNTDTISVATTRMTASAIGLGTLSISSVAAASTAIASVATAIETVSTQRATFGAVQNRLEHTVNNLGVNKENLSAAHSRIRDADMAAEMTNFTKNQILVQAGTSMLAQANSVPQNVLKLLG